jgi:transcriptional regulator with XRE-family HTH domain
MQDAVVPLSTLLRQFRDERGINQAELASMAGISAGMIGHVEAGTRALGADKAELVATVLQLNDDERRQLMEARKRTSDLLSTKPPLDENEVIRRLTGIEQSLNTLIGMLQGDASKDAHPAGTSAPPKVVDINVAKPARAAKKKTQPRPD